MRTICDMDGASKQSPQLASVEFPQQRAGSSNGEQPEPAGSAIELALRSTEAALGQVTKAMIDNIRHGGEGAQHVEAAERDLRGALRQLTIANRRPCARPAAGA
jgi:hypothetical protein